MNDKDEILTAKKIVALLDDSLEQLDRGTLTVLENARRAAVANMGGTRQVYIPALVASGWDRLTEISHHGSYRFWLPVLLLLAMVVGTISSQLMNRHPYSIDTDSLLLASELPPEVYADKEFVAWLEHTSRP